jgi:DNA-binding LacI/PurR family transcriptional regulator
MPLMAVTSRDVAQRAGVSQSTVSLVLSGKAAGRVGAATVALVEQAAADLGYRPNVAARALRTGRARSLGLVVPDVTNPFFGLLLRGAQRAAGDHGYTVALVDANRSADARRYEIRALQDAAVDGYLTFDLDPRTIDPGWNEPTVSIEGWDGDVPRVRLDVEGGIEAAARHLLDLGHTRIGHLRSKHDGQATFIARSRTLERVVGDELVAVSAEHELEDARRAGRALLGQDVTAVVCDDDILAGGLYLAARDAGRRIPDDLSVIGFDDLEIARVVDPPMTTVAAHGEQLGAAAVERLLAEMDGEGGREEVIVPVELVVRGSTGAPAARAA